MTQHAPCPICGGDVPRNQGERVSHWLRRRTCGGSGCIVAARAKAALIVRAPDAHPPCVVCGGAYPPKPADESWKKYLKRKTCGDACRKQLARRNMANFQAEARYIQNSGADHPPCVVCGGAVLRREKEDGHSHKKRSTCGRACHSQLLRQLSKAHHHPEEYGWSHTQQGQQRWKDAEAEHRAWVAEVRAREAQKAQRGRYA